MKLLKIFSNQSFKPVQFNLGFNVIMAKITDKSREKDTHNLGKTSLIHVIDFLLLGKFTAEHHLLSQKVFAEHVFYGEFILNSGKYLVVKRAVGKPSKISFKLNDTPMASFQPPSHWDNEDVPFEKAKNILNDHLGFNVLDLPYRKTVTYFLRTQSDFDDVFQLSKFRGKHQYWKQVVFSLLGFNGTLIKDKSEQEESRAEIEKTIDVLRSEAQVNPEDRDKLLGLIDIQTAKKLEIDSLMGRFNFFQADKHLNQELVESVDTQLQELNTQRYALTYQTDRIQKSLAAEHQEISIADLETLFKETNIHFTGQIKKNYSDLLDFTQKVSAERVLYLQESLDTQRAELVEVNTEIEILENRKADLLAFLTEKDSYYKFKEYQKQMVAVESELNLLNKMLAIVDKSISYKEKIKDIDEQIQFIKTAIHQEINKRCHAEINKIFNQIISRILNTNALIFLKQNQQGNVEFSAEFQKPQDLLQTAEGKGHTYKKFLCMAFDLAIQIHYASRSFFRFIYHDGMLEGLDDRKKLNLITTIKEICRQYNLQYILTLIDSDLPHQDGRVVPFEDTEISLRLHDRDATGKLFLMDF